MLRKEIFQEHDRDVSLSGACLQINDVPVAHSVIRPIASYPVVDAKLVLVRRQVLKPQVHVDCSMGVFCEIQGV